jgi:protein-S-isoprenylcysteine O-methyltransferase Ste14
MDDAVRWLDTSVFLGTGILLFASLPFGARFAIGFAIALAGFVLWMLARYQLGASFSVKAEARKLITVGIYSKIRNPIYFFGELAYLGLAIVWGRWPGFLFVALTSAWQLRRIRKEEKILEQVFGEEYRRYKASTWF